MKRKEYVYDKADYKPWRNWEDVPGGSKPHPDPMTGEGKLHSLN